VGYEPEPTVYNINFTGQGRLDGLEVKIAHMSMGERFEFDRLRLNRPNGVDEIYKWNHDIAQALADHLTWWNVEKNGEPVPTTKEGVLSQEDFVVNAISAAWIDAITGRAAVDPTRPADGQATDSDLMSSIPAQPLPAPEKSA
jgi:hypothetical protein